MSRPTGLLATKGIELLTWGTPNGHKASILLEELKAAYGLSYTFQAINIGQNIQKEPWFIALNPNGRIPLVVDHDNKGLAVFEGNAILSYLTRKYDPEHKFSFPIDSDDYTVAESWIGWGHGGIGPMQGQANHFLRAAPETIPWGINRYVGETERLFGILDARLSDRDFIVGSQRGKYSIVDIALLGWANALGALTVDTGRFPNVVAWVKRCYERPAVKSGFNIPNPPRFSLVVEPTEEQKKAYEAVHEKVVAAQEKYSYKYQSP